VNRRWAALPVQHDTQFPSLSALPAPASRTIHLRRFAGRGHANFAMLRFRTRAQASRPAGAIGASATARYSPTARKLADRLHRDLPLGGILSTTPAACVCGVEQKFHTLASCASAPPARPLTLRLRMQRNCSSPRPALARGVLELKSKSNRTSARRARSPQVRTKTPRIRNQTPSSISTAPSIFCSLLIGSRERGFYH